MLDFKFCNVDPHNCTAEELKIEIARMEHEMWDNYNLQMALKILLNSAYGVIGNKFFVCYDKNIAEAITTQGRDIIVFSAKAVEKYFKDGWHLDTELHEKMGINVHREITQPVLVAGDTDSIYISVEEVLETIDFEGDPLLFIHDLYEHKLKDYFNTILKMYAKRWNCSNLQEFEMEAISEQGFWLAKKKYALDIRWKEGGHSEYNGKIYDGQFFDKVAKRKYTGIEIKKKSTPVFARKILDEVVNYLFKVGNKINISEFTNMLKSYKEEFKLQDIDDISLLSTANNLSKYVIDDRTELKLKKGCPIHVRGAATYNFLLNQSKFKNKYELIKSGQKVKYYHVKNSSDVFAFPVGVYPIEMAPIMDYDVMFTKTILVAVNRFIEAMGKQKIPATLVSMKKLF